MCGGLSTAGGGAEEGESRVVQVRMEGLGEAQAGRERGLHGVHMCAVRVFGEGAGGIKDGGEEDGRAVETSEGGAVEKPGGGGWAWGGGSAKDACMLLRGGGAGRGGGAREWGTDLRDQAQISHLED